MREVVSPVRLVIALSVASTLAIFVVYTALAGAGVADVTPSTVSGHAGNVQVAGVVVGKPRISEANTNAGMRFQLKDIGAPNPARIAVVYHGSVPDLFKTGSDVSIQGRLQNGVFVAERGSLITKCPSHYTPARSAKT